MEHKVEHCDPCTNCYKSKGCRCKLCNRANNAYEAERRRIRSRPDSDWDNPFVSADRARNHLIFLAQHGIGVNALKRRTGIQTATLGAIRSGRKKKILRNTERKIISQAIGMYTIRPQDAIRAKRWADRQNLIEYTLSNKD
jgi:hypothetical protein